LKTTELISEAAGCVLAEVYQIQRDQDFAEEAWEALQFAWEELDANLVHRVKSKWQRDSD
jgi:hypothetical protein